MRSDVRRGVILAGMLAFSAGHAMAAKSLRATPASSNAAQKRMEDRLDCPPPRSKRVTPPPSVSSGPAGWRSFGLRIA